MRLYHDVHAISLAHANYVKDTPDILRIYLARPRHQTRPHDTQPDEIHTHRRQKVEIILHKRQVGVERRCDGDPRSILHARTHALTHALTHARTYARTLYTTFTPRKNRWRPSASTNIRSRTTTGDTPAALTATATANRHASLSWDIVVDMWSERGEIQKLPQKKQKKQKPQKKTLANLSGCRPAAADATLHLLVKCQALSVLVMY